MTLKALALSKGDLVLILCGWVGSSGLGYMKHARCGCLLRRPRFEDEIPVDVCSLWEGLMDT